MVHLTQVRPSIITENRRAYATEPVEGQQSIEGKSSPQVRPFRHRATKGHREYFFLPGRKCRTTAHTDSTWTKKSWCGNLRSPRDLEDSTCVQRPLYDVNEDQPRTFRSLGCPSRPPPPEGVATEVRGTKSIKNVVALRQSREESHDITETSNQDMLRDDEVNSAVPPRENTCYGNDELQGMKEESDSGYEEESFESDHDTEKSLADSTSESGERQGKDGVCRPQRTPRDVESMTKFPQDGDGALLHDRGEEEKVAAERVQTCWRGFLGRCESKNLLRRALQDELRELGGGKMSKVDL